MPVSTNNILTLFSAADDSTSDQLPLPIGENVDDRFTGTLFMYGSFDSATCKLQVSPDSMDTPAADSAWIDVTDANATADAAINVEFKANKIRGDIAGSTTLAAITMKLFT